MNSATEMPGALPELVPLLGKDAENIPYLKVYDASGLSWSGNWDIIPFIEVFPFDPFDTMKDPRLSWDEY